MDWRDTRLHVSHGNEAGLIIISSQREDVTNWWLQLTLALLSLCSLSDDPLITAARRVNLIKPIATFCSCM